MILDEMEVLRNDFFDNPKNHLLAQSFEELQCAKSNSEIEIRFKKQGKRVFKLEISYLIENGKHLACGILRDITVQRKTELSFAQLFERYESILQASLNGYLLINLEGFVVNCNHAFSKIIEYPEIGLHNRHLSELLSFTSLSIEEYLDSISKLESASDDAHIILHNGNTKTVEISAHLIHLHDKDLIATFIRDTSDMHKTRKRLLDAMRKSEELSSLKSSLLNNVTHEFKSPLNRIIGLCEVLENDSLAKSNLQFIQEIKSSGERLLNGLTAMMEVSKSDSRGQRQELSPVSIEKVIEEIIGLNIARANAKGLTLTFQCIQPLPIISSDAFLLKQSLKILLGNAIKFTQIGKIEMETFATDDEIQIQITDTGIGIEKEFLAHLFSPFSQESNGHDRLHEGLGLGLSLVERYAEIMNGKIEIQSAKGTGTIAKLSLPISSSN
ncbi:MAG: PAS domain S-box-containing protein [Flavobacteriales bacterium]|jgi:PAS domain S-box-containing protein